MKVTVLTENTSCNEYLDAEHGLSLLIETDGYRILFDTGQTDLFSVNADKLALDLSAVDLLIVSHGHYDHGGGIERFLEINDKANIVISRYAFESHHNASGKYIGLDQSLKNNGRFVFIEDAMKIDDNIMIYTSDGRDCSYYNDNFGLTLFENGIHIPDDFRHEIYLEITEKNRKYIFSGCSHKGVLNIMSWFTPDVFVGGFHFMKIDPINQKGLLKDLADKLLSYDTKYYTCHCTGSEQYGILKERMSDKLEYISTGMSFDL